MENCKDEVISFRGLLEDSFSFILACLEVILFSIIKQTSKAFLSKKEEQEFFFFGF